MNLTVEGLRHAAKQRLAEADYLRQRADMGLAAMYLAGYGVEISLKALLLSVTPASRRDALVEREFHGSRGHNLELLKELLKRRGCQMPPEIVRSLVAVRTWSTDLRYRAGLARERETQAFVEAAHRIHDWVERSVRR